MVTTVQNLSNTARERSPRKAKVTCRTCGLKKCTGRCQWAPAPAKQLKAFRHTR
jgi:hypothetical protein